MATESRLTKKLKILITSCFAVFLAVELALYVTFLTFDITQRGDSVAVKYAAIVLCMLFSFLYFGWPNREKMSVSFAMIFTVIADAFLLVLNYYYEIGEAVFILVQVLYAMRLLNLSKNKWWITVVVRVSACAAAVAVLGGIRMLSVLTAFTAVYFVNLLVNTAESWIYAFRRDRRMLLFAVGLTLFCVCDLCVGLNNLPVSPGVSRFVGVAMWAFYLPSQVFIVLSRFLPTEQNIFDGGVAADSVRQTETSRCDRDGRVEPAFCAETRDGAGADPSGENAAAFDREGS